MAKMAYITYFALTGTVAVVFITNKFAGSFVEDVLNEYAPTSALAWLKSLFESETVFTLDQLKQYDGVEKKELYLAILGKVYDVSKARNYYGPGESYYGFVGKDGSRAFVTGEFTRHGLTDDVLDLPLGELAGLLHWVDLYQKNYEYKGKLEGRFYDAHGQPTMYSYELERRIREAIRVKDSEVRIDRKYPACNMEWSNEIGQTVWCTKKSGGIDRDWVGVPRRFLGSGSKTSRCACVPLSAPKENADGTFEVYEDCDPFSEKCLLGFHDDP